MKLKVYSVYDVKTEAYLNPFYMKTRGEAVRAWGEVVNDPQTNFCKFPTDYVLYEIGEFDDAKGTIECYEPRIPIGTALEYKKQPEDSQGVVKLAN